MSKSIFLKDSEEYKRDLDPVSSYIKQVAEYLKLMTDHTEKNIDFEAFAKDLLNSGKFNVKNPIVHYYERQENGDKVARKNYLNNYIKEAKDNGDILVPSFTSYMHPNEKVSFLSGFTSGNLVKRKKHKKLAFEYKNKGDMVNYNLNNNDQTNYKLTNNSMSGAFATEGSILYNPSAHSTLTSTTRTETSFGNSSNERFISGNRHYWSPEIVINNILFTCVNTNYNDLIQAMDDFDLYYPTSKDVMDCILRSSKHYWIDRKKIERIQLLVDKLSMAQKAAFVYSGDFYHIRKYNDFFVRDFLTKLSKKVTGEVENPLEEIYTFLDYEINLIHHICFNEVKGLAKDYALMNEKGILSTLVLTGRNIRKVLLEYKVLIEAFFATNNIPPTVAHIKNMVRRAVVLSDTDSSCASYDEWIIWYFGKHIINEESIAIFASVMTLANESIAHILAIFSANMNVQKKNLHLLSMKNEYTWLVFCPTNVAKHYFALTAVQEGDVYSNFELEVKGVHLKNSNSNKDIMLQASNMMKEVCYKIIETGEISLGHYLKIISDTELKIIDNLKKGDIVYYRSLTIKEKEAYVDAEDSPYQAYLFYLDIFEKKYGKISPPPYSVIKIPTIISNKNALLSWANSIEDREIAKNLLSWCNKNKRKDLNTIYFPEEILTDSGVVEEILPIVDYRRLVLDLCNVFYIVLETIGYYKKPEFLISELAGIKV